MGGKGNFIPYLSSIINGTKIIGTKENDESFWTSLKFDDKSKKDECWKVNEGLRGKYNTNFDRYNVIYDDNNDDNRINNGVYVLSNNEFYNDGLKDITEDEMKKNLIMKKQKITTLGDKIDKFLEEKKDCETKYFI